MTRTVDAIAARVALAQRLRSAAEVLLPSAPPDTGSDPARDAAVLLDGLVRAVLDDPGADRVWLLLLAIAGALPNDDDVRSAVRFLQLHTTIDATLWLLDTAMAAAQSAGSATRHLRVLPGGVVVDVDRSAQHDLHTGIQQVVRNTLPLWLRDHDVEPVAWTPTYGAYRTLTRDERCRAVRTGSLPAGSPAGAAPERASDQPLVVPWKGTVVLGEVPHLDACERLAAVAQHSGNRVGAIGYDCIPIVSADQVPLVEPNRFARYLAVIKHSDAVGGISVSATTEFRGFADMLPTQGLSGPQVHECVLPNEGIGAGTVPPDDTPERGVPTVLSVGSFEPRKNHLAIVYAAERLWREGLSFRLRFIGGSGWGREFPRRIKELQAAGRPLTAEKAVSHAELEAAYREARFTVFPSLHEGFGLPVAESLAFGVPVITANFGSTKEIGAGNGAILIDPRDDGALVSAMRLLLTDDHVLAELRQMTGSVTARSWEDYARELWELLVLDGDSPSALAAT